MKNITQVFNTAVARAIQLTLEDSSATFIITK